MVRKVWIVEAMFPDVESQWGPTVGVALTRGEAEYELRRWRKRVAGGDKLRIRKYTPAPEPGDA